jgi:hypothetical protein
VFEPITGNPVLLSLDGKEKAPLAVVLHHSWTDEDRARFGVYMAEPATIPDGKVAVGQPRYERYGGKVVEIRDVGDASKPQPLRDVVAELDALAARIAALEAR